MNYIELINNFNSTLVQLEEHSRRSLQKAFPNFNSTLVQLEVSFPRMIKTPNPNFNSTLVHLEAKKLCPSNAILYVFQFHSSPIRSEKKGKITIGNTDFNSTLVQLEGPAASEYIPVALFQFHSSPIRR